ncbi:MAG TPA: NINE protein [Candidatus Eisenbacteria bacterium]|nr:NINE protein [Candidatus Eisenbacteria bacterium]
MNPICPYCRTQVGDAEGERRDCPGCGTPHHVDCFAENGGCTVFGCSHAPADEAKVTVSGTDLMGNLVTHQVLQPAVAHPPRTSVSLGAGYTTFHAPAVGGSGAATGPSSGTSAGVEIPAPPPPPLAGTGVAPPPALRPQAPAVQAPAQLVNYYQQDRPKTRVVFVLLGVFLGIFGVHNFYAGYTKKGAMQLVATVLIAFYAEIAAWLWAVVWLWAIVEICLINRDADGTQFV